MRDIARRGRRTATASAAQPRGPQVVLDRTRMADCGVTAQQVGTAVRIAVEGTVVTKLRPEDEDERRHPADRRGRGPRRRRRRSATSRSRPCATGSRCRSARRRSTDVAQVAGRPRSTAAIASASSPSARSLAGTTPATTSPTADQREARRATSQRPMPTATSHRCWAARLPTRPTALRAAAALALALSIVLIYMLLAALYESLALPLATMFALPVAIVGAFIGAGGHRQHAQPASR